MVHARVGRFIYLTTAIKTDVDFIVIYKTTFHNDFSFFRLWLKWKDDVLEVIISFGENEEA